MKRYVKLLLALLPLLTAAGTALAQGNLLVTPRRLVFEGPGRMQELNLSNTGDDTATYLVSLMEIRMKEDGSFERITEPDSGQRFAGSYLRFFPRRVTLAPRESQMVKVQLTKADELQPGEYRSHLYFRAVPVESPLGAAEKADSSDISVRLTPVFGLTIPAIIRVGAPDVQVSLSDLSLEPGEQAPRLRMAFRRSGSMSVYGDLKVEHISPQGKVVQVAAVKGIAVYTPNTLRWFRIDLDPARGVDYGSGRLRVSYEAQNKSNDKLAEAALALSGIPSSSSR